MECPISDPHIYAQIDIAYILHTAYLAGESLRRLNLTISSILTYKKICFLTSA